MYLYMHMYGWDHTVGYNYIECNNAVYMDMHGLRSLLPVATST